MIKESRETAAKIQELEAEYQKAYKVMQKKSKSFNDRNEYWIAKKHADEIAEELRKLKDAPGIKTKMRISPLTK